MGKYPLEPITELVEEFVSKFKPWNKSLECSDRTTEKLDIEFEALRQKYLSPERSYQSPAGWGGPQHFTDGVIKSIELGYTKAPFNSVVNIKQTGQTDRNYFAYCVFINDRWYIENIFYQDPKEGPRPTF